jgi:hypothetical protein
MFAHLRLGRASCYNPRGFWHSFKDYDGQPIDVREHQDAYEFFTRLQVGFLFEGPVPAWMRHTPSAYPPASADRRSTRRSTSCVSHPALRTAFNPALNSPQDSVDSYLRVTGQTPAMQAVMGGKFAAQIICKDVNYR